MHRRTGMSNEMISRRPSPQVTASMHERGIVLFHIANGQLFASNLTGAQIWQGLERQLPTDSIAEAMSLRYHIPPATARAHTAQFIARLEAECLIERSVV